MSNTSAVSCNQLTGIAAGRINSQTPTWKGSHPSTQGSTRSQAVVASGLSHVVPLSLAPAKGKEPSHPQFPTMPVPTTNTTISDVLPLSLGDDDEPEEPLSASPPRSDSESDPEPDSGDDDSRHATAHIGLFPTGNPPAHAFVLILTPGGGPLNIAPQQPHIRVTLQGANVVVIKNIVFDNAFPDTFGRSKFAADALKQVARQHGWSGLVSRIKTDEQFLHTLSGVVCSCSWIVS